MGMRQPMPMAILMTFLLKEMAVAATMTTTTTTTATMTTVTTTIKMILFGLWRDGIKLYGRKQKQKTNVIGTGAEEEEEE